MKTKFVGWREKKKKEIAEKKLTDARETAEALSVSEKTLWNYSQPRGPIPCYRLGSRVLYDLREVIEAIKGSRGEK